jgi:hypothetical protein
MTGKIKSPKIYDPYLGEMYGNILDQYDNPAYNLRLYLKKEQISAATPAGSSTGNAVATQGANTTPADLAAQGIDPRNIPSGNPTDPNLANGGSSARSDTPATATGPATPGDKNIVIVAQTGVTGNQIDNLEIDGVPDPDLSAINATFTVVQPGAANLLDQIQYARKYLGATDAELTAGDFTMYIDINFVGYTTDFENNEDEGSATQIIDTITYQLMIRKISVQVNNTGSQYEFTGSVLSSVGKNDETFKLSRDTTIRGSTITELFTSLETNYNNILISESTEYKPDEVKFDVSALVRPQPSESQGTTTTGAATQQLYIRNESIPTQGNDQTVEGATNPRYPNNAGQNQTDAINAADGASNAGTTETNLPGVNINLTKGDTIEKIVATILSMNREFRDTVTRRSGDMDDPGNTEVNDEQTFINWFDIHSQVENLGWDKDRGRYTRRYTYTPFLTQDIRSDIMLTTKEVAFLSEKGPSFGKERPITAIATKRLQDLYNAGALHKSYFYIFTGLNDQIINLDISLDNAVTILLPPSGGTAGEFSVTSAPARSNSEARNRDLSLIPELQAAQTARNKKSLVDIFNKIRGLGSEIGDRVDGIARTIDRSPAEIAGILNDATGTSVRTLVDSLAATEAQRLVRALETSEGGDPAATPTTAPLVNVTNSGSYAPEVSGFLYSEDIVQPGRFTTEEIEAAGLNVLDTNVPTGAGGPTPQTRSVNSPLGGMTSTGPSSVLMGYVYRSRSEGDHFLLNIDLSLRGDPYWLTSLADGKFEYGKSSPDKTVYPNKTAYYFLLTIGTPTQYDYNISDEDENSGYWSDGRTSGYFSGLYMPKSWKNKFSNGVYTTEIQAVKEHSVPLQWIKRVPPGTTPPAWDDYFSDEEYNDFINQAAQSRETASGDPGSNDPTTGPIPLEDLPALQLNGEKGQQAKTQAEAFLGRPITPREWELLVRANVGESGAGGGGAEDANIVAVILNRARTNFRGFGTGIEDQLYALNQFQAVTGENNSGGNTGFNNPSQQQIARTVNNILNSLGSASRTWDGFVATNPQAYAGTRRGVEGGRRLIANIRAAPGSRDIGGTVFFDSKQLPAGTF